MKIHLMLMLSTLVTLTQTTFAQTYQDILIASCTSSKNEKILCLYKDKNQSETWKSYTIRWSEDNHGRDCSNLENISMRQFVNSEIIGNSDKRLTLKQKNTFLGTGRKTTFIFNKTKLTASLKRINKTPLIIGGHPRVIEPKGTFYDFYDQCEVIE